MEDVSKDYQNPAGNRLKNLVSNLSVSMIIVVGIVILIIILISSNKQIDPKVNFVVYGVLIAIIFYLMYKPSDKMRLLTRQEALNIGRNELEYMKREGETFAHNSEIFMSDCCNLRTTGSAMGTTEYESWDIGFIERVNGTNYKKDKIIKVHPYFGIVIGIEDMPMGYTGKEKKDVQYIPIGIFQGSMKTTDLNNNPTK